MDEHENFNESHREWLHANVFDLNMNSIKQSVFDDGSLGSSKSITNSFALQLEFAHGIFVSQLKFVSESFA